MNMFASLQYLNSSIETCSLRFKIIFFTIQHVRFASLDSQFNINLLPFPSIFKFFNINMFASLRNKFSNYRTSSLRFDIENNIIIEAFDRFASLPYPQRDSVSSQRLRVSLIRWVGDSPYHWYAESATPRIVDTGSRWLPASLIRGVGYSNFLLDVDFSYFAADHGLINYIETKAKGCHLKKFTCKGTLRRVFIRVYWPQTNKHLPQSPFTGQFFRWQHFAILLWCLYS